MVSLQILKFCNFTSQKWHFVLFDSTLQSLLQYISSIDLVRIGNFLSKFTQSFVQLWEDDIYMLTILDTYAFT